MLGLNPSHMAFREKIIATSFVLIVTLISMALYDNRKSSYAAGKTTKLGSSASFSYLYRYIQASTILSAIGGCLFYDRVFLDIHDSPVFFYCGLVLAGAGIVLFSHAKLTLGKNYSPCFDSYLPLSITRTGPYRYIRHPVYTSNLLVLVGAFVMSGSLWIVPNIIMAGYFYYASAVREERELCLQLPGYAEYLKGTGRFLPLLFLTKTGLHPFL